MSSQRGSATRQRPQKHKNSIAFKNNMHDKSDKTKMINSLQVNDVCNRCKEVIEWKIKYKKYKPLTQPKTCVLCNQKTVKRAYHVMCNACGIKTGKCTKCCKSDEVVEVTVEEKPFRVDREMRLMMKELPERSRRMIKRYLEKKMEEKIGNEELREDLLKKLKELQLEVEEKNKKRKEEILRKDLLEKLENLKEKNGCEKLREDLIKKLEKLELEVDCKKKERKGEKLSKDSLKILKESKVDYEDDDFGFSDDDDDFGCGDNDEDSQSSEEEFLEEKDK